MKQKIILILLILAFIPLHSEKLELPLITDYNSVVEKENYTLQYNEKFEQADWVTYELTMEEVMGNTARKDSFRSDPDLITGSASLRDYRKSGFDRGHLSPAADNKISSNAMKESFHMSNMSPQIHSFNGGIWAELEACVRTWACDNESVFIATGAVLRKESYPTIGKNNVAVAEYFYKVIVDFTGRELKGIGFILPHEEGVEDLADYAVSIDFVEKFTGINFFPALEALGWEDQIESAYDLKSWRFVQFNKLTYTREDVVEDPPFGNDPVETMEYWINEPTDSRHNSSCRNYGSTKWGYYTPNKEGAACGLCGG